jgi:hypothetical protein
MKPIGVGITLTPIGFTLKFGTSEFLHIFAAEYKEMML